MSKRISDYKQDDNNANTGSERGQDLLMQSVVNTGLHRGIVVDVHGKIVAGNKTQLAALEAGYTKVVEVETEGDTLIVTKRNDFDLDDPDNDARLAAYMDNRAAQLNIVFDPEIINKDRTHTDIDFSGLWEKDELPPTETKQEEKDAEPQIGRADELQEIWQVEPGQLWRLPSRTQGNDHRIICGDCTDADVVSRVMGGGDVADFSFHDPPYGQLYQSNMRTKTAKFDTIENDNSVNLGFLKPAIDCSVGWVLICTSWKVSNDWQSQIKDTLVMNNLIVWNKGGGGMGDLAHSLSTDYELIMAFGRGAEIEGKRIGSVWDIGKDAPSTYAHPTQKPVGLVSLAIETFGGSIIADFFCGSSPTIIAAENLSRQCRAIEISPNYVSVSLQRYVDAFGIQPELTN